MVSIKILITLFFITLVKSTILNDDTKENTFSSDNFYLFKEGNKTFISMEWRGRNYPIKNYEALNFGIFPEDNCKKWVKKYSGVLPDRCFIKKDNDTKNLLNENIINNWVTINITDTYYNFSTLSNATKRTYIGNYFKNNNRDSKILISYPYNYNNIITIENITNELVSNIFRYRFFNFSFEDKIENVDCPYCSIKFGKTKKKCNYNVSKTIFQNSEFILEAGKSINIDYYSNEAKYEFEVFKSYNITGEVLAYYKNPPLNKNNTTKVIDNNYFFYSFNKLDFKNSEKYLGYKITVNYHIKPLAIIKNCNQMEYFDNN